MRDEFHHLRKFHFFISFSSFGKWWFLNLYLTANNLPPFFPYWSIDFFLTELPTVPSPHFWHGSVSRNTFISLCSVLSLPQEPKILSATSQKKVKRIWWIFQISGGYPPMDLTVWLSNNKYVVAVKELCHHLGMVGKWSQKKVFPKPR